MTLASLLRAGLVAQIGLGAVIGAWLLPRELLWLALPIGLAVPLIGTGLLLACEFAIGARVDPRSPPLPAGGIVALWWTETWINVRVFHFAQALRSGFAEPTLVRDPQRPAVLLVHGYLCNRAVWRTLLDSGLLARCNVATVNLLPVFGPLDDYADVIHAAVARLATATGAAQVILVGHSMGGLAIRVYLRRHGAATVAKVVTIATPHHGTIFGALGAGRNAKQMARGSGFLAELARSLAPEQEARFVCFAARDDNLIVPRSSPLLPQTRHVVFERVGHLAMLEDRRVWLALRDELLGAASPGLAQPMAAGGVRQQQPDGAL